MTGRARLAAGLVRYLRDPLDPSTALANVDARVRGRERAFLDFARDALFADSRSPHGRLLEAAGWDHARLSGAVGQHGLEAALANLRDAGVWTSNEELKCRRPIERLGLELSPAERDFDPPHLRRAPLRAATGGTSSPSSPTVPYDWELFAEEAALECLLFEAHGCLDAPWALWLPAPPGIAGIHNVLVHLLFRRPPERWFSHLAGRVRDAAALRFVQFTARTAGLRVPLPKPTRRDQADQVARWLHGERRKAGCAVLKTFASSAVHVAEAARGEGLDLTGAVIFAGGEPLTDRRREYIESTGARVFARYVTTETGWVAGACPNAPTPAHMHLYSDRLAVIDGPEGDRLLFTTVSGAGGKQLLNTDLGDAGTLGRRHCSCPLGQAGLDLEIHDVHGHDKVSGEGVTVERAVLHRVIDEVVAEHGGSPDSYQLHTREDDRGGTRLVIQVSPDLQGPTDDELVAGVLERLPVHGGAEMAPGLWRGADVMEVHRAEPRLTRAMKLAPPTPSLPAPDPERWAALYRSATPAAYVFRHTAEVAARYCLAESSPGSLWLDVGCGTGDLAAELARAGLNVVGIDRAEIMVEFAGERFAGAERLRFEVADAGALPFDDSSADGIVATSLAGCLEELGPFLAEARRVLRPGGRLVISFTNRGSPLHVLQHGLRRLGTPANPWAEPVQLYTRSEAIAAVRESGLEPAGVRSYNFFVGVGRVMLPPRRMALALEPVLAGGRLGRNLLVVALRRRP